MTAAKRMSVSGYSHVDGAQVVMKPTRMAPLKPAIAPPTTNTVIFMRHGVLAERLGRNLVLAHGAQGASVRRVDDPLDDEEDDHRQDQRAGGVRPEVAVGVWVELVRKWLGNE